MNIYLKGQLTGISANDLNDVEATLDCIGDACGDLYDELADQLLQYKLDRLVRFCQTGSLE